MWLVLILALTLSSEPAGASDYTLRTPSLPPPPPTERTEYMRLAKEAGLTPSSMMSPAPEVYGSTPKWDRFQRLAKRLRAAKAAAERGQGRSENLMELVVRELGAPDWVQKTCGRYHENQCGAVLAGADGPEAQQRARTSPVVYELTWFNGPCRPIQLLFTPSVTEYRIPGYGPWSLMVGPAQGATTFCVSGGSAYPDWRHPVDYYSCRQRPGRTGCSSLQPD